MNQPRQIFTPRHKIIGGIIGLIFTWISYVILPRLIEMCGLDQIFVTTITIVGMIVTAFIGSSIAFLVISKFAPPRPLASDSNGFEMASMGEQADRIIARLSREKWAILSNPPQTKKVHYARDVAKAAPFGYTGYYIIHIIRRYRDKKYMTIVGVWDISPEWKGLIDKIPEHIRDSFHKKVQRISKKAHDSYNLWTWPPKELRFEFRHYCDDLGDGPHIAEKADKIAGWQHELDGVIRRYFTNETDIASPPDLFLANSDTFRIEPLKG